MLENRVINGKNVIVAYLDDNFQPVDSAHATMAKVITVGQDGVPEDIEFLAVNGLQKFRPDQARNADGEWTSEGGGAGGTGTTTSTAVSRAKHAIGLSTKKIRGAVNLAASQLSANSKDILAGVTATVIAGFAKGGLGDMEQEAIKESIHHLAVKLEVPASVARDYVVNTVKKLRAMNVKKTDDITKADNNSVLELLDKLIAYLEKLDLKEKTNGRAPKAN